MKFKKGDQFFVYYTRHPSKLLYKIVKIQEFHEVFGFDVIGKMSDGRWFMSDLTCRIGGKMNRAIYLKYTPLNNLSALLWGVK